MTNFALAEMRMSLQHFSWAVRINLYITNGCIDQNDVFINDWLLYNWLHGWAAGSGAQDVLKI